MKRNLDLIKEILLWIQNNSDGRRDITASRIQIEGSDTQEIEMHLHWIQDEGLIAYEGRKLKQGARLVHCTRLTSKGCDVLAAINNHSVWNKRGYQLELKNHREAVSMKNVKRVISLTLLFVFALAAMAFAYIGNARSGIFHYDSCQYVYRMNNSNKVYFDSREDAVDAGYRPCRVCRP